MAARPVRRYPTRYLHGRGGFWSDAWDSVKDFGRGVWKEVRAPLARAAGTGLTRVLGGLGDYKVSKNSILDEGHDPPLIANSERYNVFRHREYICDISTPGSAFTIQSFPINPGLVGTFPWFSTLAVNYVSYKPRGIVFEFKSLSADALNSTNTALGEVIMATQTNAGAPAFVNQQQMLNYDKVVGTKPSCSCYAPVECDPRFLPYKEYFVRQGGIPTGADPRLYDMGIFYIATYGQQAASVIGQLFVTYEFEMVTPQQVGGAGAATFTDFWSSTSGISTSHYFGTTVYPSSGNSIGLKLGAATIDFPSFLTQGVYQLTYSVVGSATSTLQPAVSATSNCSIINVLGSTYSGPNNGATLVTIQTQVYVVQLTGPNARITITGGTLPSSATNMELFVTQVDSDNGFNSLGTATIIP